MYDTMDTAVWGVDLKVLADVDYVLVVTGDDYDCKYFEKYWKSPHT